MTIQKTLEEELARLINEYKLGWELKIVWMPKQIRDVFPPMEMNKKDEKLLGGEIKDNTIYVYCDTKEESLHVLRHEYFEAVFNLLIEPIIIVYNRMHKALEQAFMDVHYMDKELIIEKFVEMEERKIELAKRNKQAGN